MADPVRAEKQRRPYQKPAFEHEEVFETMALACEKHNSNQCPPPKTDKAS